VPHDKVHYKSGAVDERVKNISAITQEFEPPFIIPLYGGVNKTACATYKQIAQSLDPDKFECITLADMAWMAKKLAEK